MKAKNMRFILLTATVLPRLALAAGCGANPNVTPAPAGPPQSIPVAVIGGMVETGFWQALAEGRREDSEQVPEGRDGCLRTAIAVSVAQESPTALPASLRL